MGILGIGAGASGGLDNYLHQLLQEQQQAEVERRNRATEALTSRGQDLAEAQHRLATQQRGDVLAANEQNRTVGRAALRGIGDVVQPGEQAQEIGAGVPSSAYSKIPGLRSASTTGFQTAPDVTSKLTGFGGTPQSGQASTVSEQGSPMTQWAGTGAQREQTARDEREQRKLDILENKQPQEHNRPTILTDKGFVYSDTGEPVKGPEGRQLQGKPPTADSDESIQQGQDENGRAVFLVVNKRTGTSRPVTGPAGSPLQPKQGQTVESRLSSAKAVVQTGNKIIADLTDPAYADKLGPVLGRYSNLLDFIGNPPPEYSELAGLIESYSLANMGVHGMRSAQGAAVIAKLMHQPHTPASMIATIRGLNGFANNFLANAGREIPPEQAGGAVPGGGGNDAYSRYLARTKKPGG